MAKPIDIKDLTQKTAKFGKSWKKKLGDLSQAVSRGGLDGASHWLKSHHQTDELNAAIDDLLLASEEPDFSLLQVETTLSSFVLPEEDLGQAEWYKTAHDFLTQFEIKLVEKQQFDSKLLQSAIKELKFISQADEFHQRYRIQSIQEKVSKVYQSLQQSIIDFKNIEQEKNQLLKQESKQKLAQAEADKAQAQSKKAMIENIKIKEKRIAIIEEKKRLLAEKELVEAKEAQQREEFELKAKQSEDERQAKLQDSYIELQMEEKISSWQIEDFIEKMTAKLRQQEPTDEQKETLEAFVEYLQSNS